MDERTAACVRADPELFTTADDLQAISAALSYCYRCVIVDECGDWAGRDKWTGVAGGAVHVLGRRKTLMAVYQRRLSGTGKPAATVCTNERCGNAISGRRRRYCSLKCAKAQAERERRRRTKP
ncbi:MAG: WhiB family transcriptional regulator [Streptosporangiales bacterium]|nr:WhiB family transcriptional regulator [Streptosporangiales bacterium]